MNRTILAVLVSCLLVCFSCSGLQDLADQIGADQDNVEQIGDTLDDTGTSGMEIGPTDLDTLELTEIFDFVDAAEVELVSECAPGDGCFLDKCDDNEDCQSGWCVQYLGESICTQTCTEECPTGWNCKQVAGTDPDVIYICVSGYANLCRPCSGNADCTSIGAIEDACLDYGEGGNFCGGSCGPDESCPWGFSCQEISTIQGAVLSQCVADTGECPCTDNSVSLGLATPCSITNDAGTCDGLRVCTEDGLSDCDAAVPALETCNGVDDDCDGDVDEPDLVEGAFIHLCDDGNQCTADKCLEDQGCVNEPLEGGDCSDGNPCTVADLCTAGVCAGDPVQCDDENPCTDNICTETGGCEYPAAVGPCDDGNPCTVADQCSDTLCAGTPVSCDCQTDDDCSAFEDGNVCNGTLYCNLGKLPYLCAVDLDTIIECPQPEGPGAICLARSCDPDSGACSFVPANDGFLCDDDDKCTLPGTCTDGECIAGPQVNCNDGNPCTDDSCNPESGCIYTANSAACNDGDVCTTGDTCGEGKCMGGVALVCNDGDICNGSESCEAATGCVTGTPLVCEDNNLCTGTEWCDPVDGCKPGTPMICNDDNPCDGEETCDPAVGCLAGQPLVCDDGNLCNGKEVCDLTEGCLSGAPLDCDDLNPCTDDQCSFDIGCVHENNQAACDDSNLCTTGDHCQDGLCKGSGVQDCDDNNLCTDDSCDSVLGCVHKLNQAPCNDENVCTTGDHCELGACQGGGQIPCNDGNTCTTDSCNPQAGCEFTPDNAAECDDGSACTTGDFCKNGKCVVTSIKNCDDNNLCTDD